MNLSYYIVRMHSTVHIKLSNDIYQKEWWKNVGVYEMIYYQVTWKQVSRVGCGFGGCGRKWVFGVVGVGVVCFILRNKRERTDCTMLRPMTNKTCPWAVIRSSTPRTWLCWVFVRLAVKWWPLIFQVRGMDTVDCMLIRVFTCIRVNRFIAIPPVMRTTFGTISKRATIDWILQIFNSHFV